MKRTIKRKIIVLLLFCIVLSLPIHVFATEIDGQGINASDESNIPEGFFDEIDTMSILYESEPNNTIATADVVYPFDNMYGRLTGTSDVDYYKVTCSNGSMNFWIECATNSAQYQYVVYNSSGGAIGSTSLYNKLVTIPVSAGTYYIKVYGNGGYYNSNEQYMFRCALYSYKATIMQGNTVSESDCLATYNGLKNRGYTIASTPGWTYYGPQSSAINQQRVTSSEFLSAKSSEVAYYSGHGAKGICPTLNATASLMYGTSSPFDVANLLGVSGTNWQTACQWRSSDPIRVLILASCFQLDSSVVQYYARIMRASGIRAVTGYHEQAPSYGDDTIATNFFNNATSGESIYSSWKTANSAQNWAVLVYTENSNLYYRLPGFPGATYSTPSSTAGIYRYRSGNDVASPVVLSASSNLIIEDKVYPLAIEVASPPTARTAPIFENREPTHGDSVIITDTSIQPLLQGYLTEAELGNMICTNRDIIREEVDTELGVKEETAMVVEKQYNYYNTYDGIKIADAYIAFFVDSVGVNTVNNLWKTVASSNSPSTTIKGRDMISVSSAVETAETRAEQEHSITDFVVHNKNLAYAPSDNGVYRLCYEIASSIGKYYVDVGTGELL